MTTLPLRRRKVQRRSRSSRRSLVLFCAVLVALLMGACGGESPSLLPQENVDEIVRTYTRFTDPPERLGERPAGRLKEIAEGYLRTYQPDGPLPKVFETTRIYDRNGELLAELFDEGRRTWVPLERISPHLVNATIATEDSTFYTNPGIDTRRMVGAAMQNVEAKEVLSGASTITMQLARSLFLPPDDRFEQSVERKMLEIELAQELTDLFTKEEILELYFNLLNYGHQAYGPEAAARAYFGKGADELTVAEATLMAGIPQQPANLDLFTNFAEARERQRIVLNLMVRHGYLRTAEADAIFASEVTLATPPQAPPVQAPHFVQYLLEEMEAQLSAGANLTGDQRIDPRRTGLTVISTLDMGMQTLAQRTVTEWIGRLQPRYGMSNGALVALLPTSGEILAMVGSVDFDNEAIDGQVNVAISPRQPGSAIKPVLYAAALDDAVVSPATVLWDTPTQYLVSADQIYSPRNYDGRFHGLVTVRSALANSYNVPAVKVLYTVGGERMLEMAHRMGIRSLQGSAADYGLSLTLGAGEVSLLELTGAYRVLANEGVYSPVAAVQQMVDSQNRVVYAQSGGLGEQVVSDATAFLLSDILSDNAARTPAFGANSVLRLSRPAAVKTGTTTDWRDNWTVGYTRHLVAGVWTGNSDGRPMRGSSGAAGAAPIWRAFMDAVLADPEMLSLFQATDAEESWAFRAPPSVEMRDACPPRVTCRADGEYFSRHWLATAGEAGPLAGTVVTRATVPTHTDRSGNSYWPSYCSLQSGDQARTGGVLAASGEVRSLLWLSGWVGLAFGASSGESGEAMTAVASGVGEPLAPGENVIVYYPDSELERFRQLGWSLRSGIPVYLGRCDSLNYYTVQPGDGWTSLARRIGLSPAELQAANPQAIRGGGLVPGDRLLLPQGLMIRPDGDSRYHTVVSGDTWSTIASTYGISFRLLVTANPDLLRDNYILQPGDVLLVPEEVAIYANPFE